MAKIRAIFWDVGGVLLTNAWDREQREQTLAEFGLDTSEFQDRHEMLVSSLERGKIGLDEYLDRTIFYRPRPFGREQFRQAVLALSQPHPETLELARKIRASGKYLMATVNNESRDLNLYRIRTFGLQPLFDFFLSSCFLGLRKPEAGIYKLALETTQQAPEECCFIDDRALNVDSAQQLGMHGIVMQGAAQLRQDLRNLGVDEV
jgi:putative hydrolase of the HAD superfamily